MPNLRDILEEAGVDFDALGDRINVFEEYDPTRENLLQGLFQSREESIQNQLGRLPQQRGFVQERFQQNVGQARTGARENLLGLLGQTQSRAGEAGFRSGALNRTAERGREQTRTRFGQQQAAFGTQRAQQLENIGSQRTSLLNQQEQLGIQEQSRLFDLRQGFRERTLDRLMDLIQSGADVFGDDVQVPGGDEGGAGLGGGSGGAGGTLPGEGGGGAGPDIPPTAGPSTINTGPLSGQGVGGWGPDEWQQWYANWYANNAEPTALSLLTQGNAQSWSPEQWMGWYQQEFGAPNPFT